MHLYLAVCLLLAALLETGPNPPAPPEQAIMADPEQCEDPAVAPVEQLLGASLKEDRAQQGPPQEGPVLLTRGKVQEDQRFSVPWPPEEVPRWKPERFLVGVGDRFGEPDERGSYGPWIGQGAKYGADINAIGMWVTRDYKDEWIDQQGLVEMARRGVRPVLIFYYFGDEISQEFVSAEYDNYVEWLKRALADLAGDYEALVVLEPEFNNDPPSGTHVKEWKPFADLMIRAAAEVRHSLPRAKVGLCPGDYRAYDLWDILGEVSPYLDFLAFEELWGSTRRNWLGTDYEDVSGYALLYTTYLSVVYHKPVLLAYLGVSTYQGDADLSWHDVAWYVWTRMDVKLPQMTDAGLFGILAFALFDDPTHTGYFGDAEVNWGLVTAEGEPKKVLRAFRKISRRIKSLKPILPE